MPELKRNDPCHCGSGLKYKSCHLGKANPVETRERIRLPLGVLAVGLGSAIAVAFTHTFMSGVVVAGAAVISAGCLYVFRDPPPPRPGGTPGAIDFGG